MTAGDLDEPGKAVVGIRRRDKRFGRGARRRKDLSASLTSVQPRGGDGSGHPELVEPSGLGRLEAGVDADAHLTGRLGDDFAAPVQRRDQVAAVVRNEQSTGPTSGADTVADGDQQLVDPFAGRAEIATGRGMRARAADLGGPSDLLNTSSSGTSTAPISRAPRADRGDLAARGRRADASTTCSSRSASATTSSVDANASHQLVRQLPDEADRVGEQHRFAAGQLQPARGGVERGEQPVLDQHVGAR